MRAGTFYYPTNKGGKTAKPAPAPEEAEESTEEAEVVEEDVERPMDVQPQGTSSTNGDVTPESTTSVQTNVQDEESNKPRIRRARSTGGPTMAVSTEPTSTQVAPGVAGGVPQPEADRYRFRKQEVVYSNPEKGYEEYNRETIDEKLKEVQDQPKFYQGDKAPTLEVAEKEGVHEAITPAELGNIKDLTIRILKPEIVDGAEKTDSTPAKPNMLKYVAEDVTLERLEELHTVKAGESNHFEPKSFVTYLDGFTQSEGYKLSLAVLKARLVTGKSFGSTEKAEEKVARYENTKALLCSVKHNYLRDTSFSYFLNKLNGRPALLPLDVIRDLLQAGAEVYLYAKSKHPLQGAVLLDAENKPLFDFKEGANDDQKTLTIPVRVALDPKDPKKVITHEAMLLSSAKLRGQKEVESFAAEALYLEEILKVTAQAITEGKDLNYLGERIEAVQGLYDSLFTKYYGRSVGYEDTSDQADDHSVQLTAEAATATLFEDKANITAKFVKTYLEGLYKHEFDTTANKVVVKGRIYDTIRKPYIEKLKSLSSK